LTADPRCAVACCKGAVPKDALLRHQAADHGILTKVEYVLLLYLTSALGRENAVNRNVLNQDISSEVNVPVPEFSALAY